jgi:3-dehydroquinate synthetase
MITVPIALNAHNYDIHVGADLLIKTEEHITPVLRQKRTMIVTDTNIAKLHLTKLEATLNRTEIKHNTLVLPPNEHTKNFSFLQKLLNDLLDLGIKRHTMLITLGNNVIDNLANFTTSILLHDIEFVQVPTTLLTQINNSIGDKTAIDTHQNKNLINTFHQPRLVLTDLKTLATLPEREFLTNYAEVVKYNLIDD